MAFARIPWPEMPWSRGENPLERKKAESARGVTMLEFAPGFVDPSWCDRGHVILVLDGTLDLDIEGAATERVRSGEAATLDPGTRHRAKNGGQGPVRLFVVAR